MNRHCCFTGKFLVIAKYIYIAIGLPKPWTANFVPLILLKQKLLQPIWLTPRRKIIS
ncbi:hypothetical protein V6Z12_A13G259900 [Gossypium hirsutum]